MQFIGCVLFAAYGVVQFLAAYLGLDYYVGPFFAAVIIGVCLWLRFTLPITIGSFFGALYVWEWHWFFALIFAAPGLLLMVPSILATVVEHTRHRVQR